MGIKSCEESHKESQFTKGIISRVQVDEAAKKACLAHTL